MKVIHVIPSLASRTGGPAFAVLYLARALAERGIEAPIFSTNQPAPAQLGTAGMAVDLSLPAIASDCDVRLFPIARLARFSYAPRLGEALRIEAKSADLIHVHTLFLYPTYAALQASSSARKPLVVSPHASLDPRIRRKGRLRKAVTHAAWQSRLFRRAAAGVALAPEEADCWPRYAQRPAIHVVPNGIDLSEFHNLPNGIAFRTEIGISREEPLIVNVGRIAAGKGLDTLIRAGANLHRMGVLAHVALVGPDDEGLGLRLRALAATECIDRYVHFTGSRDGLEKLDALAAADAWALPSHGDGFPIAVLEALAAGKAVLVSNAVKLAPQIAAAGAGVVTSPSVYETTDGLRKILGDATLRRRLETKSRVFAAQFDSSRVAAKMEKVYRQILETRSRGDLAEA